MLGNTDVSHYRAEASHYRPLADVKAYSHYLDWLSLKKNKGRPSDWLCVCLLLPRNKTVYTNHRATLAFEV